MRHHLVLFSIYGKPKDKCQYIEADKKLYELLKKLKKCTEIRLIINNLTTKKEQIRYYVNETEANTKTTKKHTCQHKVLSISQEMLQGSIRLNKKISTKAATSIQIVQKSGIVLLFLATIFIMSFIIANERALQSYRKLTNEIELRKQTEKSKAKSLEEKEMLLKEIHHRVKNNLQIIYSFLNLQKRKICDKKAVESFVCSQVRIKSMAFIHEKFYHSENLDSINFASYIKKLCTYLILNYRKQAVDVNYQLEDIKLPIDKAIPCGLIFNEIMSNALKHAFPDNQNGQITIDFHHFSKQNLILSVKDNGVGFEKRKNNNEHETLGMALIQSLVEQLDADITIETAKNNGTAITLLFHNGAIVL